MASRLLSNGPTVGSKEVASKPCLVTIYMYDTYQRLFSIKTISDDITGAAAAMWQAE
jgi:hypothetical protein